MLASLSMGEVQARSWWRAWGVPSVWLPAAAVLPWMALALAGGYRWAWGAAALSASAALLRGLYRWLWSRPALQTEVLASWQATAEAEHQAYLRRLRTQLRADRDARTGEHAKGLQAMRARWNQLRERPQSDAQLAAWDAALLSWNELYVQTVHSLEQSWTLWLSAQQLHDPTRRMATLETREAIVEQVGQTLQQLQGALDQWQQALDAPSRGEPQRATELRQLQQELDAGLEIARRVDRRLQDLEQDMTRHIDPLSAIPEN